ncbi:hypothetical protein A1A1_09821 [Planococcus antarcticus DSM 14505]|uniref:Uncharacterized protein n=1 Tax=Planococcus antarcticus DSM 14505 TaxID=1185653 RepID=A0A1C7DGQ0_9BACL|nr:hypothetical protein [Planococcus antarcticus]ANU10739.1 hypothetical protein BBH88_10690 [Planococcus antarcticus DSM 14505]EIM06834.1 hypothetical protein A1A1_09821 [Planococcus antarcticus DSM 14505]
MKKQQSGSCDCIQEIDRMIDEGLSGGTINPKYTKVHRKLKEKYQSPSFDLSVELPKKGEEIK